MAYGAIAISTPAARPAGNLALVASFGVMTMPILNDLSIACHADNAQWWHDPATGKPIERNKGELLMLIVSEVSEAMEGERKDLMDNHLTHRRMAEVELADVLIRIFDYAGAFGYDLDGAVAEKRAYNKQRADHKLEARIRADGKKW
jgi:NTP pyrophosphatase (non-canonical NTP hydrolase)